MLQQKKPSDYVISTGVSKSVRQFAEEAYSCIGVKINWKGKGLNELGIDKKTKKTIIKIDKYYFRPTEVLELRGDSSKARKELGWKPSTSFKQLVKTMVSKDIHKLYDLISLKDDIKKPLINIYKMPLNPIGSYKMDELKQMANEYKISLKNGIKNKVKKDLYEEIKMSM